jgi:hypothetical protein
MRAIVINSRNRIVVEIDLVPTLDRLQQIVGGLIEPVEQCLDEDHHCYVSEEGLLTTRSIFSCSPAGISRAPATPLFSPRPGTATRRRAACRSNGSKSA